MIFPKKQAQRLIPEYLLDYTTKLNESHPDPTESWGGGSGGSYTSGDGITINDNVISVDNTIARKSEIPTKTSELTNDSDFITSTALNNYVTTTQLDGKLTDYALKSDIPSLDGYATQTWVENQGYSKFSGSYNDLTDKPDLSIYAQSANLSTVATTGSYNDLIDKPTLATVATTGSYNDLIDKPTIPDTSNFVTTNTEQTITGFKTFNGGLILPGLGGAYTMQPLGVGAFRFNDTTTQHQIDFMLPIEKSGTDYTIATTDDIHNPTITFTQGGTTKGTITLNQSGDQTIEFDAGGGGGSTTNMVTTDTTQDITGEKTFVGQKRIKFKQHSQSDKLGFTGYDANGTEIGYLEMSKDDMDFPRGTISNMLGYWSNVNSAPNPTSDVMLGFKYYTKDSDGNKRDYRLVVPPRYNEVRATRYIPISVNGNTADNTGNINVPTETLVFTLSDGSQVTLNVMTSATASTTTTS